MLSAFYINKLSSLHVDRSSGHPKPHKVCLLLAIIDLIESSKITENKFVINDELKAAFSNHFSHLKKGNDANKIIQPFYYLKTDGIWHFKLKAGQDKEFKRLSDKGTMPSKKALFDVIDYAYVDDELFSFFQNELSRREAREALLENLEDLSVQFHRWLLAMGKSEKTAINYVSAIKGSISNWSLDAGICEKNLISIQSFSKLNSIAEELISYDVFIDKNTKGKHMYSAALNSYKDFLALTCQAEVSEDIELIINDKTISNTQKSVLVNTRVGQGIFRESLIKYWNGCAITGYQSTQFLVASHIKPWRSANDVERLDKFNGILLLPNLDKAFDLGYISFSEKGNIKTSEFIETPAKLGINDKMKINFEDEHQEYLAYHREVIFERKY